MSKNTQRNYLKGTNKAKSIQKTPNLNKQIFACKK